MVPNSTNGAARAGHGAAPTQSGERAVPLHPPVEVKCPDCGGAGWIERGSVGTETCPTCDGSRYVMETEWHVSVSVGFTVAVHAATRDAAKEYGLERAETLAERLLELGDVVSSGTDVDVIDAEDAVAARRLAYERALRRARA